MTQLAPAGVFVMIEATHLCMSMRGVQALGSITVTTALRGAFESDQGLCDRTLRMIKGGNV
jgi:GTP cyclohydrolase I